MLLFITICILNILYSNRQDKCNSEMKMFQKLEFIIVEIIKIGIITITMIMVKAVQYEFLISISKISK